MPANTQLVSKKSSAPQSSLKMSYLFYTYITYIYVDIQLCGKVFENKTRNFDFIFLCAPRTKNVYETIFQSYILIVYDAYRLRTRR